MHWMEKNGMVLTQSAARALFKDQNPIGETVNWGQNYDFVVNAVIEDVPENSCYKADAFVSIMCLMDLASGMLNNPGNWSITTFVEVKENAKCYSC